MKYKFNDKKPIELTEEETYELVKQIADIEYSRNINAKLYQDADDGAVELLTYALEKDARGKKGLNSYKQLDMKHFRNLIHLEIRNGLNYHFRQKKVQKLILEPDSLNKTVFDNSNSTTLLNLQADNQANLALENDLIIEDVDASIDTQLEEILAKVNNSSSKRFYIRINFGIDKNIIYPFSYRNLTELYFNLSNNKKLANKEFKGFLFNKFTDEPLEDSVIKKLLKNYKNYMKKNNILGGDAI